MRLVGRHDLFLLGGLAVALFVVFSQALARLFELVHDIERSSGLRLLPALVILAGVFVFHQLRNRHEMKIEALAAAAAARQATERAAEMERLVAFGQALARSLNEESIHAAASVHIPLLAPGRDAWVLVRSAADWRSLLTIGTASPGARERAARMALGEADPSVAPTGFTCFPMIIAGTPVGVLGIGVSCYVEVTSGMRAGSEFGRVEIRGADDDADGGDRSPVEAIVTTGSSPHGQGLATALAMLVADSTGLPVEAVREVHGDTDAVARGTGTFGSRSLQLGGSAALESTRAVVAAARERAAEQLEASVDDVVLDPATGRFHVVGSPAVGRSWADVVAPGARAGVAGPEPAAGTGELAAETDFSTTQPTYPFGAHVAVVEVDTETGATRLLRLVACDDAGRVVNPLLAEGQRHGGLAQGAAQALYEQVAFDPDGNPLTTNFADYAVVSAAELPSFELVDMQTPTWVNPLGAKGIGESGTIGATPAVQNAVCDALAPLGVRHVDMPCTPERVWRAIRAAAAS